MPFYRPSCLLPFCLILFSLSLLSFYWFVLRGWGLPTDRVIISLSQPCTVNLFIIMLLIIFPLIMLPKSKSLKCRMPRRMDLTFYTKCFHLVNVQFIFNKFYDRCNTIIVHIGDRYS